VLNGITANDLYMSVINMAIYAQSFLVGYQMIDLCPQGMKIYAWICCRQSHVPQYRSRNNGYFMTKLMLQIILYRVFHFEVSISVPRLDLDLGSKSQQILTFARERSIWDFQPLGVKARPMSVDFSDTRDVKFVC
jgi:hypothetical protein